MRALRILAASVWYFVCTAVNNREPLFWSPLERARFKRVIDEARVRYEFELRGLRFCGPWVSFYIKPADGLMLPEIMQWIKQTYAVRYNAHDGRTGHIWGDRYQSVIVDGPPEDAEEYVFAPVECKTGRGVRKRGTGSGGGVPESGFSAADPALDAKGRPRAGKRALNSGPPPDSPRRTAPPHS
ncbi:MAG: transposase [Spirochaetaceae bacterium]|jgi:REP element-mobilizing transposase RayT|nr:transposase [Spirochaetaceae bacterium]